MDEMRISNEYLLLKEIKFLSDNELNKLLELISLFKNEVRNSSSTSIDFDFQAFLSSFGSWEDSKNTNKIIEEIHNSRYTDREVNI